MSDPARTSSSPARRSAAANSHAGSPEAGDRASRAELARARALAADPEAQEAAAYPGARRPDRRRTLLCHGLELAISEWGDEGGHPILFAHGGFDFAGTFDRFAPLLADAGYRVVSWDQRGHGDSAHAALYSWDADVRDMLAVLDSIGPGPIPVLGHSKGGGIAMHLIQAVPHRISRFVNVDGIPSQQNPPDVADHDRTKLLATEISAWLDHRARAGSKVRRPDTVAGLAARRRRMNPRLSPAWLRYLVTVGARRDEDGWRWKIDPALRPGGFGPWRAVWSLRRMVALPVPMLAILGLESEPMGWGTTPELARPYLPRGAELEVYEDTGHFVHIEQPERVARRVLEFLS